MRNNIKKETKGKANEIMTDETLQGKDIIDTSKYETLYSILEAESFPCFAALEAAGFEFPDMQCKIDFSSYAKSSNGVSIEFSYRFDGYGEFIPMETMHIVDVEGGLEAWMLTEVAYACVLKSPQFYVQLIKTLPHGERMLKQLEKINATLGEIMSLAYEE